MERWGNISVTWRTHSSLQSWTLAHSDWADLAHQLIRNPRGSEWDEGPTSPRQILLWLRTLSLPNFLLLFPLAVALLRACPRSLLAETGSGGRNKPGYGSVQCQHFSGGPMCFCQASISHYNIRFLTLIAAEEAWSVRLPHPTKALAAL